MSMYFIIVIPELAESKRIAFGYEASSGISCHPERSEGSRFFAALRMTKRRFQLPLE